MKLDYLLTEINIEELSEKHFKQLRQIFIENNEIYNYPLRRDSDDAIEKSMLEKKEFETERKRYVAINSDTDEIQSYCSLVSSIGKSNRHIAYGRLISLKSNRKQGIGKKLLGFAIKDLSKEIEILTFSIRSDETKKEQKPDSQLDLYLQRIGGKFVL